MCGYGKVCAYVFGGSGACILCDPFCAGTAMVALPPLLFLLLVCSLPNVTVVTVVSGRGATSGTSLRSPSFLVLVYLSVRWSVTPDNLPRVRLRLLRRLGRFESLKHQASKTFSPFLLATSFDSRYRSVISRRWLD